MSEQQPRLCATVRSKSSSYLDGRLSAEGRRAVQQHLNRCEECMSELQAIAKLSRATHNLPQHRVPSDMASRVRQRMATHRGETIAKLTTPRWRSRAAIAAAALVLASTSWTAGFWMGHHTPPAETAELPKSVPPRDADESTAPAPTPPRGVAPTAPLDTDSFRLASHNVLQDLAIAPNLPEHAQQPLIAAQLAYFDLPQRARPILQAAAPDSIEHRLAMFVTELDQAITSKTSIDWAQWQQRAEQRGLLERTASPNSQLASRPPGERATTIVDRFPSELNVEERQSLAELLILKHKRLAGNVTTSLDLIERWQNESARSSTFTLATGTESTRTLIEAGRPDDAQRMFRVMRTHVRSGSSSASIREGGDLNTALQNRAEEMLDRMMREMGLPPNPGGN